MPGIPRLLKGHLNLLFKHRLQHISKKALQGGDELITEALLIVVLKSVPTGSGESADKPKGGEMEQGLRTRTDGGTVDGAGTSAFREGRMSVRVRRPG